MNGAADFADGKLDVGDVFSFDSGAPYTLEAWVKPAQDTADGTYRLIASREGGGGSREGYDIWFQAAPTPRFGFEQRIGGVGTSVTAAPTRSI
jgi:hypothetical protein